MCPGKELGPEFPLPRLPPIFFPESRLPLRVRHTRSSRHRTPGGVGARGSGLGGQSLGVLWEGRGGRLEGAREQGGPGVMETGALEGGANP